MVLSRPMDDPASAVISLDARRAELRRRRRRHAMREWAGLAAVTAVAVWLAVISLITLLAH